MCPLTLVKISSSLASDGETCHFVNLNANVELPLHVVDMATSWANDLSDVPKRCRVQVGLVHVTSSRVAERLSGVVVNLRAGDLYDASFSCWEVAIATATTAAAAATSFSVTISVRAAAVAVVITVLHDSFSSEYDWVHNAKRVSLISF